MFSEFLINNDVLLCDNLNKEVYIYLIQILILALYANNNTITVIPSIISQTIFLLLLSGSGG